MYYIGFHSTVVWFIASIEYSGQYRMTVLNSTTISEKVFVRSFSFNSIQLLPWLLLFVKSIASSWLRYCWLYSTTRSGGEYDILKYYYNYLFKITGLSWYLLFHFNAWNIYATKYRNKVHSNYFVVIGARFQTTGIFERISDWQCIFTVPPYSRVDSTTYQKVGEISW